MAYQAGWQKHLWFKKETTLGTGVTPDIRMPFDTYDVLPVSEYYAAATHVGVRQRRQPQQPSRKFLRGTLAGPLLGLVASSKTCAQWIMELAISGPAALTPDSWTIGLYDPNDQKRHTGMCCNSLTLTGSAGGPIMYSMAMEGVLEAQTSAPSLVATTKHGKAFMMQDATFALAGSAATLRSFTLTINNNLRVEHVNGTWPSIIAQMTREVTWQFELFKSASTYDALRRAATVTNITGQLVLKGDHEGDLSDTYATATIDFDRMNFNQASEQGGRDDLGSQQADYVVIKPDTTDNEIDITWSTAA